MTPSISVSQVRFDEALSQFLVRGWMYPPESVSRIIVENGVQSRAAVLGTRRADVLRSRPEVTTAYCGFEVAIAGNLSDQLRLRAYDAGGRVFRTQNLQEHATVTTQADDIRYQLVARQLEPGLDRISLILRAVAALGPEARLQLGDLRPQPLRELHPNLAKAYYAAETDPKLRYLQASIPVGDVPDAAALPVRLHVGREILEFAVPPAPSIWPSVAARVHQAQWSEQTGVLVVTGSINSASVTSVRVLVGAEVIGSGATYVNPQAQSHAQGNTHFHVETHCPAALARDGQVAVEFLVGDSVVDLAERRIVARTGTAVRFPAGPVNDSYGGALYQFPVSTDRQSLPYVAIFVGMPAWPIIGGATARTYALARHLMTAGYRVVLIATNPPGPHDWVSHLAAYCDALALVRSEAVGDRFGHIDVATYRRGDSAALRMLPTIEAIFAPHAFIVNYAFNMYGTVNLRAPVILDAHDVQYKRAANARENGGDLEDRRCTRAEEGALMGMAESVLAITASDVPELEVLGSGRPILAVPHAQDIFETSPPTAQSLERLFFVGQKYAPNIDGIRAFIIGVWPDLLARHPGMELHVAGRVCEALTDLEGPGITLHGQVDSLDALYETCGIVLNPAPYGTGLKIKAVEGLARGRCVIATPEGRRGLPEGAPLITAALGDFGAAILDLLEDPQKAVALAAAAADFAAARFGPAHVYAPLVAQLARLAPPLPLAPVAARLTGQSLVGSDIALGFEMQPSPEPRPMTIRLRHAGRDIFRVSRLIGAGAGAIAFRLPFPLWLADGVARRFEVLWEGGRQTIHIGAKRDLITPFGTTMPDWADHNGMRGGLWLIEPPLEIERRAMGVARQRMRGYDVRFRNRLAAQAWGWVPEAASSGDAALAHLAFSHDLSRGNGDDRLQFHDRQTGLIAFSVARSKLGGQSRGAKEDRVLSLAALDPIWGPDWPQAIGIGQALPVERLAATGLIGNEAFIRLATIVRPLHNIGHIALEFPQDTDEEDVVRWSLFVDGVPQVMKPQISFVAGGVVSLHRVGLPRNEIVRLELRGFPGARALSPPLLLRPEQ